MIQIYIQTYSNDVSCLCLNQREDVTMCLTAVKSGRSAPQHCDATADASDQFGGRGGRPKDAGCIWMPLDATDCEMS